MLSLEVFLIRNYDFPCTLQYANWTVHTTCFSCVCTGLLLGGDCSTAMLCSMQPSTLLYVFSVAWRISSILCSTNKIDSVCPWWSYLVNSYTWAIFIRLKFISIHSEFTGEIPNTSSRAGSKPGILSLIFVGALGEQIKLEDNWSNKNLFSVFHLPKFGYKIASLFIYLFEWHIMRFHCSLRHFDKCCVTIAPKSDYTKHPYSRSTAPA